MNFKCVILERSPECLVGNFTTLANLPSGLLITCCCLIVPGFEILSFHMFSIRSHGLPPGLFGFLQPSQNIPGDRFVRIWCESHCADAPPLKMKNGWRFVSPNNHLAKTISPFCVMRWKVFARSTYRRRTRLLCIAIWISGNTQKKPVPPVIYEGSEYSRLWGKNVYLLSSFSCSTDPLFCFSGVMMDHPCPDKSDLRNLKM